MVHGGVLSQLEDFRGVKGVKIFELFGNLLGFSGMLGFFLGIKLVLPADDYIFSVIYFNCVVRLNLEGVGLSAVVAGVDSETINFSMTIVGDDWWKKRVFWPALRHSKATPWCWLVVHSGWYWRSETILASW